MIPDLETYRAARLLVDRHGQEALEYADRRAQQMLEDGDLEGVGIWRAIMSAIEELQRERGPGEAVN
jgi:triphosphoribosyl-dephospho-CoA synthetase